MASDVVRLGIVGAGTVAQVVHLPLLLDRPDLFAVTALCDVSPAALQAAGRRYGVAPAQRHERLESLLAAGGVDALLVLTSGSHGATCAAALDAGLPVFCEKPLAYTLAETDALDRPGARLFVGYMKLYDPAFRRALALAAGRPPARAVEVTVLHPSQESQLRHVHRGTAGGVPAAARAGFEQERTALVERALGPAPAALGRLYTDVLLGSVVHELALVRELGRDPVRIDHVDVWPEEAFPPSVSVLGLLPGDVRLSLRWHYLAGYPAYREEVRVHDEQGTVALAFPSPWLLHAPTELTLFDVADGSARATTFRSVAEAFAEELAAFHRLVVAGEPPAAGPAEGRADIVTCQRIVRRLAEQRGLELGGEAGRA